MYSESLDGDYTIRHHFVNQTEAHTRGENGLETTRQRIGWDGILDLEGSGSRRVNEPGTA